MRLPALFVPRKPDISALTAKKEIDGLIKALRYPDFDIQWQAAAALGALGTDAMDHLLSALPHHSTEIRLGIIEALGEIRDFRATQALLHLLKDENHEVRWATAIALGEIGDLRALSPLVLSLLDPDKYVRYGAAIALEKLGWQPKNVSEQVYYYVGKQEWDKILALGPEAVDPLLPLLKDKDAEVRIRVIEILGTLGGDRAKRFCRVTLSDSDTNVRWSAVLSSLKCGLSHKQLPLGVSRRKKGEKNPYIAGFLNFAFPGIGYQYSGTLPSGAGFAIWQTYLLSLLVVLLFVNGAFPVTGSRLAFFTVLYPFYGWLDLPTWMTGANMILYGISTILAFHVWYRVENAPDLL
jgi:HEAT repeat protein